MENLVNAGFHTIVYKLKHMANKDGDLEEEYDLYKPLVNETGKLIKGIILFKPFFYFGIYESNPLQL